jgi:hypothetical protein
MRLVVVADTGPLHYLVLIHASELLPRLFGGVVIPEIVAAELSQPSTPAVVHTWLSAAPAWLERRSITAAGAFSRRLGAGERAARHDLVDLAEMFDRLKRTNFRYPPEMLDALLAQHVKRE